jgi:non-specific serine/threonine protein kinase
LGIEQTASGLSARLITLTGTGGTGKTRLALQVAADLLDRFVDGVWLVELASLSDPALLPQTVASALGVREAGNRELPGRERESRTPAGEPLLSALAEHLRDRRALLLLDNCEHLIAACAELAEALLRACRDLRILASSREALGIAGETIFIVPSLDLPDADLTPSPSPTRRGEPRYPQLSSPRRGGAGGGVPKDLITALHDCESVRLFVDRAVSNLPSFALTERNAPAVAHVCRRLNGIPLAIELAAARVKALSVEQIAARMDDFFRLLTGGSRTAMPRHQTLRAAIDWSHDLLSAPERALFRRLSVFVDGWTLEAAETVCAGLSLEPQALSLEKPAFDSTLNTQRSTLPLEEWQVLDLLAQLVGKSLVLVEEQGGAVRYRMLETMRQYASERLRESGEAATLRERHWEWFVALAEQAEPELSRSEQAVWLHRLAREHDNLRAAMEWCMESAPAGALRLAGALWRYCLMRGHLREGRGWLEAAIARAAPAEILTPQWAQALHGVGALAWLQGDQAAARSRLDESVAAWRQLGDRRGVASALAWLGLEPMGRGDYDAARALLEESLESFRELGDARGIARSLNNLGEVARIQGDYPRAAALYQESLSLGRKEGHKGSIAMSLHNLGQVAGHEGGLPLAATFFRDSLVLFQEIGDRRGVAACLAGAAAVATGEGQPERAARLFGAAEVLLDAIGAPLPPTDQAEFERNAAAARALLNEETFTAAWAEGRSWSLEQAVREATRDP